MVQHMMGALFEHQFFSALRPCRANDRHASSTGELHGRNAHTTTGTVDQYTLAGNPVCPLEQGVIRRAIRHVDGSTVGE